MIFIKSNNFLSVIIPVYNTKSHLKNCLDSILDKKAEGYELILVDDGSTDGSGDICDRYENAYDFIKVVHKRNGGLASARNAGLSVANGKYITFVDSDDFVEKNYINSIKDNIEKYKSDIIVFSHFMDFTELSYRTDCILSDKINASPQEAIRTLEAKFAFNMCWNKVYKKEMLNRPVKTEFVCNSEPGEDLIFNCLCFQKSKTVTVLSLPLYHYVRRGEDTLANRFRKDLFEKNKVFIDYRNNLYKNLGIDTEDVENLAKGNINYIFACVPNMYRSGKHLKNNERLAFYKEIIASNDVAYWIANTAPAGILQKQFFALYKTGSPFIMDLFYLILMGFRNSFNRTWIKIRKKFVHGKANH